MKKIFSLLKTQQSFTGVVKTTTEKTFGEFKDSTVDTVSLSLRFTQTPNGESSTVEVTVAKIKNGNPETGAGYLLIGILPETEVYLSKMRYASFQIRTTGWNSGKITVTLCDSKGNDVELVPKNEKVGKSKQACQQVSTKRPECAHSLE